MREGALRKNATRAVMYIFLIAVSLISVFPLYWSFISAFNNTQQILGGWLLPSTHLLENLQHLFEQHNVVRALFLKYIIRNGVAMLGRMKPVHELMSFALVNIWNSGTRTATNGTIIASIRIAITVSFALS